MKRIILTAAALTLAGPALAASQLEMTHDVKAGVYTTAQLAEMHLASDTNAGEIRFHQTKGVLVFSTTGPSPEIVATPKAATHSGS